MNDVIRYKVQWLSNTGMAFCCEVVASSCHNLIDEAVDALLEYCRKTKRNTANFHLQFIMEIR